MKTTLSLAVLVAALAPCVVTGHATEVRHCITLDMKLRIYIQHWHGESAPSSYDTMNLQDNAPGGLFSTSVPSGHINNVQNVETGLPGCEHTISDALTKCHNQLHDDWVWYDFPAKVGETVSYTILAGNSQMLEEGCPELLPVTINGVLEAPTEEEAAKQTGWDPNSGVSMADHLASKGIQLNSIQRNSAQAPPNPTKAPPNPATPSANGDPHFEAWNGDKFDFHGECDLVLTENKDFANGLGLTVHIRTEMDTWWSYIKTAAIRIGEHTLEITGGKKKIGYYLDGVEVKDMETGKGTLGDFPIKFKRHSELQSQTRISLGGKFEQDAISIETYKRFVRVNFKVENKAKFYGSHGMLGSYPTGQKVARDLKTIIEDPNEFGLEWQVKPVDGTLFHAIGSVQHPTKCLLPSAEMKKSQKRRLRESSISEEDASLACARVAKKDRDACIFDVLATQDKGMAGSY